MADMLGRSLLKLMDRSFVERNGIKNEQEEILLALNMEVAAGPLYLKKKARIYEELESFELAQAQWERVLDEDPYDREAQNELEKLEVHLLKRQAAEMRVATFATLESLGPESARQSYSQTLQLYERILSLRPGDEEATRDLEDLKRHFQESAGAPRSRPLSVVSLAVGDLFPSLLQYYRNHPVGTVTLKNPYGEDVRELSASLHIKKFMDFPQPTEKVALLKPGDEVTLDLRVVFNDAVLNLQENVPVQAKVEFAYKINGAAETFAQTALLTIYRSTALFWDDSAKIGSFIMPNEGVVTHMSSRFADADYQENGLRMPGKFLRAVRISDALGIYGIRYIEDPESPISEVLGSSGVVDTVRYPRTTLLIGSGDCDDTTALLGSLLEASGIKTAVMTSPGHVFLAFDSGEPESSRWLFESEDVLTVRHEGTLWIPIETTVLEQGFFASWRSASDLYRQHLPADEIEFLPTSELWARFPPLPLPETRFTLWEPSQAEIEALYNRSIEDFSLQLYKGELKSLSTRLEELSGRRALGLLNRIGILHARFGYDREAEAAFERAIEGDPAYASPYLNLANLRLSRGELNEALELVKTGLDHKPASAPMHLLMSRIYRKKGMNALAVEHLERVKELSPALAERSGAPQERSARGDSRAPDAEELLWMDDEEGDL
jgi:tetratricopeptide (TPR) repeat protein